MSKEIIFLLRSSGGDLYIDVASYGIRKIILHILHLI